jgi:biopolymer transport protein TolQ
MQGNILQLILDAGLMVKFVLLVLMFFSVVSWAIIVKKFFHLRAAERESLSFYHSFKRTKDIETLFAASGKYVSSPIANVFREVVADTPLDDLEQVGNALKRYEALETAKLERHLSFLATCGSATPFIGLFGTVWGIMSAFISIGEAGSASLAVVAPGIAEALIATAMGLVAAIPAVIAYNYYLSGSRRLGIEMEDFSAELLSMFGRMKNEG